MVTMENSNMTEFEENVSFDIDDPDFAPSKNTTITHNILRGMQFTDITFGVNKWSKVCIVVRRKLEENWIHVDISFLPEKSTSSRCAVI
uniref:EX4.8-5.8 n=1 Tax=Apis mellifera TaxID=7460 RepID=Q6V485_APIME|nr:EX4.8-5.8 [Apis mellifera]